MAVFNICPLRIASARRNMTSTFLSILMSHSRRFAMTVFWQKFSSVPESLEVSLISLDEWWLSHLIAAWSGVQQTIIDDAVDQSKERLYCCVKANSRYFKHLPWHFYLGVANMWFLFTFYWCVIVDFLIRKHMESLLFSICNICTQS